MSVLTVWLTASSGLADMTLEFFSIVGGAVAAAGSGVIDTARRDDLFGWPSRLGAIFSPRGPSAPMASSSDSVRSKISRAGLAADLSNVDMSRRLVLAIGDKEAERVWLQSRMTLIVSVSSFEDPLPRGSSIGSDLTCSATSGYDG